MLCVCKKIDTYEQSKRNNLDKNRDFVSVETDGIYLDNIRVINKKADLQFAVFQLLLKNHALCCIYSKRIGLKAYQIASEFSRQNEKFADVNKNIRQSIAKINANFQKKCNKRICDRIILSHPNHGYYLDPKVAIVLSQLSQK